MEAINVALKKVQFRDGCSAIFFRAAHLHCVLAQRVEPRVKVLAGDSGFDAFPVDNVQEADVAERVSRIGTDGVEDGVELDEVEEQHDKGEEPPEGGQEPRRWRLQRWRLEIK